ncbi:MAG TPA: beta-galactosidase [Candidatus Methylacidiphilales bacterium]|nr:beta-galactosidase [Candidatus Methylacidiphilales bacterium]
MKSLLTFLFYAVATGSFVASPAQADEPAAGKKWSAAGIMYLCDDSPGPLQNQPAHFDNLAANGLMFRTAWSEMEKNEGDYNWSKVDAMLAAAQVAHKPMGLGVAAGIRSPSWLAKTGVQMMTGRVIRSFAATQTMSFPLPWDPVYLDKWGTFLNMLGKRYDSNPNLAYITMAGMGIAFEPFMAKAPDDIEKFRSLGGLHSWTDGAEKIIDLYAQAFPHTPFIFAMNRPIPTPDADDALSTVVEYGLDKYPGRFGVMYHGLDSTTSELDYYGRTVEENSGKTTVGYQTVWSTTGINARWLKGSLEDVLESGVRTKAHFIEVYGSDCDDPQYSALLQRVGNELKSLCGAIPPGRNG